MHGHWDLPPGSINDELGGGDHGRASVNMGIAIVVPAKKILETINQPELAAIIEREERDLLRSQG